jgi:hypothetical protein
MRAYMLALHSWFHLHPAAAGAGFMSQSVTQILLHYRALGIPWLLGQKHSCMPADLQLAT